jgi:hypothetical protein
MDDYCRSMDASQLCSAARDGRGWSRQDHESFIAVALRVTADTSLIRARLASLSRFAGRGKEGRVVHVTG